MTIIINLIETLVILLPILIGVAYVTIAERKCMGSMQRRVGPNSVGIWGLLQPFADALKLIVKENLIPIQANKFLFYLGPIITLIFALIGWVIVPLNSGVTISDLPLGIFYSFAITAVGSYGILLAGWAANSKYSFLGSLRSSAQIISYELIFTSTILLIVFITGNLNYTKVVFLQESIPFLFPLLPVFILFLISALAETNRAPLDLAEAESELTAGFFTEHSSTIFVFFFLAEYANILLISTIGSLLFLGGYNYYFDLPQLLLEYLNPQLNHLFYNLHFSYNLNSYFPFFHFDYIWLPNSDPYPLPSPSLTNSNYNSDPYPFPSSSSSSSSSSSNYAFVYESLTLISSLVLSIKILIFVFVFIWVRAAFPRIRYDQLMNICWTVLLPIVFVFTILLPCILFSFDWLPINL